MGIGLALAGGGMKGAAYIGALRALQDIGIKIDYISGTSSGSIIATLYSVGYTCDEIQEIFVNSYQSIVRIEKKPIISSLGKYLTKKKIGISGLIPGERINLLVQEAVARKNCTNISDVKIPLAVISVDTISTKECIFMSKNYNLSDDNLEYIYDIPLGKVVQSSMAFPGIFTTCQFKKYNFIDGGTKDNLPVKVLKDMGADTTIGLSFKIDDYNIENQNLFSVLLRSVDIFSQGSLRNSQKMADVAIEIDAKGTGLISTSSIERCIEIGYNSIINNAEKILKNVYKM